ncbi:hypothetical protein [Salipaludibacillus daqingensis]|uniref:hypothetical protein n=1 Tax=Salipaludibacillus daqingensis TaxID=3041001 RepID=UPI00247680BD|nr:hypothetical protein [Salipaludibacillus daqingensis]
MTVTFVYDSRLGIDIPDLEGSWEQLSIDKQSETLAKWENIRGIIPDRIKELENSINYLQNQLYQESNFQLSCEINNEISELASIINDLWIWYRTGEEIHVTHV